MPNQKHLTLDDRSYIQTGLNGGYSFKRIAEQLDKDHTTISKEVRRHRSLHKTGAYGRVTNRCIHKRSCAIQGLCESLHCKREYCRSCNKCNELCPDFHEDHCPYLSQPPYVCNGCKMKSRCVLTKYLYLAITAHKTYRETLSFSREGISYSEEEIQGIDEVIAPLVKKKQSIHHIYVSQADKLCCSERTIYNLVDQCALTVRNIDLPRKVRYRPRRRSKPFKVDKNCLKGRSYQDFLAFLQDQPDTPIVQMDTVEGRKGGKVMLTIHEFIRMVLPKGSSFDYLTQDHVCLLASHVNSLIRKKLNDRSPATTFSFFHGAQVLRDLNITAIPPEEVTLSPALLTACKEVPGSDGENL